MASFLVGRLATVVVRALNRSIADDTLNALVAQRDRQVLNLFASQAMPFGPPFSVLNKPDLPEPLLF
eukprot:14039730-Ditylum_brightwellii.AAC.1